MAYDRQMTPRSASKLLTLVENAVAREVLTLQKHLLIRIAVLMQRETASARSVNLSP